LRSYGQGWERLYAGLARNRQRSAGYSRSGGGESTADPAHRRIACALSQDCEPGRPLDRLALPLAATTVMEAAIPMSKVDPATCRGVNLADLVTRIIYNRYLIPNRA